MGTRIEFILNGVDQVIDVEPDASLLEVLRDQCGLISPKDGCTPQGQCGCCTVIVDDRAVVSCAMPARAAAGKRVQTLEGFSERERDVFASSFIACGGLQCGFCTPGIIVRAKNLIDKSPEPTDDQINRILSMHHCRCTGYVKIVDSIKQAACTMRGGPGPELESSGSIGASTPRYEARELALGDRPFIDDMKFPGMLHGVVLLSEHPRALVNRIDTAPALAIPGVVAVVTAADVRGERYQGLIYKDWPIFVAEGEETRYVGDVIAAVAAIDRRTARAAVQAIAVEYDVRQPVVDREAALLPGAPRLHKKGNLLSKSEISRGNVESALAASAHVASHTFNTQFIEHMFLEPESCIALPENDGLRVYTQGQGVFDDRRQIASALGLEPDRVFVTLISNGGAFGGKEDMSIQAQTALLARVTGRPVRLTLSREESLRMHPKRHPIKMTYTVGCDAQGRLTAVKADMIGDKGAYASVGSKVLERAAGHCTGPYKVDNVHVVSLAVYTNNPPCGAMRGFGANQSAFAMESMMDILAEKVGIDGWEIRYINALDVGDKFCTGQQLESSVGLKKTLEAVKEQYRAAKYAGIGCGIKNVGIGNGLPEYGKAMLEVHDDGTVGIYTGYTEMGQGLFTLLQQTACEETGLPPQIFSYVSADTKYDLDCGQTTASRATFLGCRAVQEAARKLKAEMGDPGAAPVTSGDRAPAGAATRLRELAGRTYYGEVLIDDTVSLEARSERPRTHFAYGFATQVVILDDDGRIKKVIAAHDVGKVMNPVLLEGQIEGSVHMGLGFALTEEFIVKDGIPQTMTCNSQGLLRARHMPEVELVLVEDKHPDGPYGAKGVGEIGLVPTAGAVAGALYRYDGIRRFTLPMKDSAAARYIRAPK
ncbi:MAG TPA: selenium-dependent xanthine dehydrogenase [Blastocatellia bacterium]|nr:selenium-dependent xanthine dehydrogenase [Blastocatellia bacterium]